MPELLVPAIQVAQGRSRTMYSFAVDGKLICQFAAVSRLRSGDLMQILGYQRPEVVNHVAGIRRYLEGDDPLLPNAIVLAFRPMVTFEPTGGVLDGCEGPVVGHLRIPWEPNAPMSERPAWVVDGQQRLAAIRDARVESFSVCATAFITADEDVQREQFLLLNNTKPLPKALVYELLPGTGGVLPDALARKRLPALLTQVLNTDERSPFHRRIRTATNHEGDVRDNSVMRMIGHSLTDGMLLRVRLGEEESDVQTKAMLDALKTFWCGVRSTWPDAWKLPPRRSRLLHGAGIFSLGFVMDEMAELHRDSGGLTEEQVETDLRHLQGACFWTSGAWPLGEGRERVWNEIQNTPRDINVLSNYLLRQYRLRVRESRASRN